MKTFLKRILIYVLCITILFSFSGCSSPIGVEELAYVIAIGLDSADDDTIELTLQFATAGSGDSSGSSMQSTKTNVSSVKCTTIDSGITLINSHISKKINLSHCKEIIISEELAKKGVEDYLDTFINNTELTNDAEMIISKCKAKEYIENVNPVFEGLLSKYYTATQKTDTYTAYSTSMNLATFYCLLKDTYYQPYATIGTISKKSNGDDSQSDKSESKSSNSSEDSEESSKSSSESSPSDMNSGSDSESGDTSTVPTQNSVNANFMAGEYEFDDKNPIQIIGFAAFNNDKLVGEFTGLDSICFSIINNEFEESILSIPSPFEENKYIDLSITSNKKTKCRVDLSQTNPLIQVNVYLTGFGQSMDKQTSYSNEESIQKIKQSAEIYMKQNIESFLNKTSKEYNSDICGFGRFAVKHYLTMEQWEDSHWLDNYKNCTFDVNVLFNIKAGNVFSET